MNELQNLAIASADHEKRLQAIEKELGKKPKKPPKGSFEQEAETVGDPPPDPNQLSLPVVKQGVPGGNSIIP